MAAGMMPQGGGGGGGVLGWDLFGNQPANPKPNLRDFSDPGRYRAPPMHRGRNPGLDNVPRTQTGQQKQDFQQAERRWKLREEEQRKRQDMYSEMAQTTGPTPKGVDVGQYKEAGDPLSPVQVAGGQAPTYEPALFGQPRKRRERYRSIVNLRNP